jgi:hypothetical protein
MAFRRMLAVALGAALLMGLTASPLSAAKSTEKLYRLDITPTTVGTGTSTIELKFTNITPGNSTFNSFEFTVPSPFVLQSARISAAVPAQPGAVVSASGDHVTVVVLDPVKNQNYVTVEVTVTSNVTGCVATSATWVTTEPSMRVWTGSNLSGSTFRIDASTGTTTTIDPGCQFRFTTQPSDTVVNAAIAPAVTVALGRLVGGVFTPDPSIDTGTVSLFSSPSASLSGNTATFTDGVATFSSLSVAAAGTYTLTASYSTFSATSSSFTVYQECLDEPITIGGATVTPIGDTGTSCVPVTIDFNGTQITVLKPTGTNARALVTIDNWSAETATNPIDATEVDTPDPSALDDGLNGDNVAGDGWHPIQWCFGGPYDPTAASFDPLTFDWSTISLPGDEVSCLLYQESHLDGLGNIVVSEHIYLDGDWGAKRT